MSQVPIKLSELEYVNDPVLLLVGGSKLNEESPYVFDEIIKLLSRVIETS